MSYRIVRISNQYDAFVNSVMHITSYYPPHKYNRYPDEAFAECAKAQIPPQWQKAPFTLIDMSAEKAASILNKKEYPKCLHIVEISLHKNDKSNSPPDHHVIGWFDDDLSYLQENRIEAVLLSIKDLR